MKRAIDFAWRVGFALLACGACVVPAAGETVRATVLEFIEQESAGEPSALRMIVTPEFLRIDGGGNDTDFLLYHRARRVIYNVSTPDRLILVMPARPVPPPGPAALVHTAERQRGPALPRVDGKSVRHYRLFTNGELCYELYAAAGLLPDAAAALTEYRNALAGEQAAALAYTPAEMQSPCDLANHVYAPARHLAHGFPVRWVEIDGRARERRRLTELTDYRRDAEVPRRLFELPDAFRRLSLPELRRR